MKDGVILCTSVEQGAKIIKYFQSLGVDTAYMKGSLTGKYYGVYKGSFNWFPKLYVEKKNIPILTLPDETHEIPEINFEGVEMEVSYNGKEWAKRIVFAKFKGVYLVFNIMQDQVLMVNFARPIQPKLTVTKEQIAEKFGTTVDKFIIED